MRAELNFDTLIHRAHGLFSHRQLATIFNPNKIQKILKDILTNIEQNYVSGYACSVVAGQLVIFIDIPTLETVFITFYISQLFTDNQTNFCI